MEAKVTLTEISQQVTQAARQLIELAAPERGDIFVLGCSTSEIAGHKIGSASSMEIAQAVVDPLLTVVTAAGLYLAVQCCEHLNRALVVSRQLWRAYGLYRVTAIPHRRAGGACAERAYQLLAEPVLVESLQGHLGLDIGSTLIGMHLLPVVVPVRLAVDRVGRAHLVAARTRPKLIGGQRARYPEDTVRKGPGKTAGGEGDCGS